MSTNELHERIYAPHGLFEEVGEGLVLQDLPPLARKPTTVRLVRARFRSCQSPITKADARSRGCGGNDSRNGRD